MFYFAHFLINFKKKLCRERAQSAVEYFIIFVVVAIVALLGAAAFLGDSRKVATEFFNKSFTKIAGEPVQVGDVDIP